MPLPSPAGRSLRGIGYLTGRTAEEDASRTCFSLGARKPDRTSQTCPMRHVLLSVPEPDGGHDLSCSIFRRARAHGRWPRCRGRGADCVRGVCGPLPRRGPVHCPTLPQDAGAPGARPCNSRVRDSVSELLHPEPLYLRWPSAKFEQHPVAQPLRDLALAGLRKRNDGRQLRWARSPRSANRSATRTISFAELVGIARAFRGWAFGY